MNIKPIDKTKQKANRSPETPAPHPLGKSVPAAAERFAKASKKIRKRPTSGALAEKPTKREKWDELVEKLDHLVKASEKPRKQMKTASFPRLAPDQPLSVQELLEIQAIVEGGACPDPGFGMSALWIDHPPSKLAYGQLASLPEAQLLVWMDSVETCLTNAAMNPDNDVDPPSRFKQHVFDWLVEKVMGNDSGFFARLSFLLAARMEGRRMSTISLKELGFPQSRGRKPRPHDLECCARAGIFEVLSYRVWMIPEGGGLNLREFRITRDELQHAIKKARSDAGMANSIEISNCELSRWIDKTGIRRFMAKG